MRTVETIRKDIEWLRQEIRYARAEGDERSVEELYAEIEALQNEMQNV